MPRRHSILASRNSRAALPFSDAPEWELISPGIRLGYRKGRGTRSRTGSWLAASRSPQGQRVQVRLGKADDVSPADGTSILSHEQAKEKARAWAKHLALTSSREATGCLTLDAVLDHYLEVREAEGMRSMVDARCRASLHIRPALGRVRLTELTVERVRKWRNDLARSPARVRTAKHATKPAFRPFDPSDPETLRKRRDTANRTFTLLKAALNWALAHNLVEDDRAWRLVKPFPNTTAARVRFLDQKEQKQLLEATGGGLRDLISAALVTGARFGELARLRCRDFDPANGSVFIAESKSGKPRHVPLPPGGVRLFARLAEGKRGNDFLLLQDNGSPWKPATYQRPFKAALRAAELENLTLHELRHTYASTMVRAGAPMMIVAQALGHSDTRMAEKHYAHLAPSYVADVIRSTAPDLAA